jgi:hypothetical protein
MPEIKKRNLGYIKLKMSGGGGKVKGKTKKVILRKLEREMEDLTRY